MRRAEGRQEPLEGGAYASTLTAVPSVTDYALARRAVLRDFRSGALTRLDVCDAHPELMRAAQNIGVGMRRPVPGLRRVQPAPRQVRLRRQAQAGQRPGDLRHRASWRSWAPRATSSPATTSRCASTASGTTCAASRSTAACTRAEPRRLRSARRRLRARLVRVLRAARDAPHLGLGYDGLRAFPVPRRGHDVDAPDPHELGVGEAAVVAGVGRRHRADDTASGLENSRVRYYARVAAGSRVCPGRRRCRDGRFFPADDRVRVSLARKGAEPPLVMVTAYDAPSARTVDAAGADMILVGDSLAMVVLGYDDTLQVTTADMAHHVAAVARTQSERARRRRPAVAQLPREPRGDRAQRGVARARGRRRGEARRRPQAHRRGAGDPRRRDPGDGPHRPHAAVDPRARRLQGAGQGARRGAGAHRRRDRARRGRLLRDRARVRARRGRPHDHRVGAGADDRHRRRPSLRRPGARVARPARLRGRGSPAAEVRARVRGVRARRDERDRAVLRRRARRHVPVERRDVPHDRPDGRGPRSLRRVGARPSPSSPSSDAVSTRARLAVAVAIALRRRRSASWCSRCTGSADDVARRGCRCGLRDDAARSRRSPGIAKCAIASASGACASWWPTRRRDASAGCAASPTSGPTTACCSCSRTTADTAFTMAGVSDAARDRAGTRRDGALGRRRPHAPVPGRATARSCPVYRDRPAVPLRARDARRVGGPRALGPLRLTAARRWCCRTPCVGSLPIGRSR